jgi:hypothetical protein
MPLLDQVISKVKDESKRLTDLDDYIPAIDAALERYSKHRPLEVVADLPGAGAADLDLPEGWQAEFSQIRAVEYPVGSNPEELLAADEWSIYRSPGGFKLRLRWDKPEAGESVRITYTAPRAESDIPAGDVDAVACLAASICLRTLAALMGHSVDASISADSVNRGSKTDEFRRLADALEARFNAHLGVDAKGGAPAASAIAAAPRSGRTRLTH